MCSAERDLQRLYNSGVEGADVSPFLPCEHSLHDICFLVTSIKVPKCLAEVKAEQCFFSMKSA